LSVPMKGATRWKKFGFL